jgi:opacity protein-like surface antigen
VRYVLAIFLTCCACAAQSITVGAIGGGRLTGDVLSFPSPEANSVSVAAAFRLESRFYDVGPTIEIGLTHGFAVELDAVYHRQGFYSTFYHDTLYNTNGERDNSWEFPLLLKYNLRVSVLHPFVEAGVAPRTITGRGVGTFQTDGYTLSPPSITSFPASYSPSVGFLAGGGLQFNLGHLRLAPQVRYTRWATTPVSGLYYSIGSTYSSNQNQLDMLVGISWKVK